jgi:glyoxylase-like metal-dependent hydrolase (beta-lactamase superfamily II)
MLILFLLCFIMLVVALILAVYLLLCRGAWPKKSGFSIDFSEVRELADAPARELPVSINRLIIATGKLPGWVVVAGDFGKRRSVIEFPSFQVVYETGSIIIEVPFNERLFNKFPYGEEFYVRNYGLMQQAMENADLIIPTHEHWDHLGGIAQSDDCAGILRKTILTKEQIGGPTIADAEFPESSFDNLKPIEYDRYYSAAPGVVLIKAPGHSIGHQFVFVRLRNGNEFLFTGDVVWTNDNFSRKRSRPWLVSKKRMENRTQISHQMKYLYEEFHANVNQTINLVSTHDPRQHEEYIFRGLMKSGFQV